MFNIMDEALDTYNEWKKNPMLYNPKLNNVRIIDSYEAEIEVEAVLRGAIHEVTIEFKINTEEE